MQQNELITLIQNPKLLEKHHVAELQKLCSDFPYFQPANVLLSMAAKKWDASVYQQCLKKTAIVVTNRTRLFELIHQMEEPNEVQEPAIPSTEIKQIISNNTETATSSEDINVLKATEIASENQIEEPITQQEPFSVTNEDQLEQEIANKVVVSFVETELLKTNQTNNKPDPFEAPHNFSDWLYYLKKNNGQSLEQIQNQVNEFKEKNDSKNTQVPAIDTKAETDLDELALRKQKNGALIDKIIQSNPGHIKIKEEQKFYTPDSKARESLLENEHLVTETLAKIYVIQGNINKAIRAYEILSLKYPQKSAYFASLIQDLKNN
jgi:hypothetical protein